MTDRILAGARAEMGKAAEQAAKQINVAVGELEMSRRLFGSALAVPGMTAPSGHAAIVTLARTRIGSSKAGRR
jgi:hypothetical protein